MEHQITLNEQEANLIKAFLEVDKSAQWMTSTDKAIIKGILEKLSEDK